MDRRPDDLHQTDGCGGLNVDEPALGVGGCLPFEVGCPAFTRELRQVRWPSVRTFKPEIREKYDGRLNPAEFLSIYTIDVQAAAGRDEKVFANYFPLALKSNVRSWLMHLPKNSISSWDDLCHEFIGAFTGGHKPHDQESDLHLLAQEDMEFVQQVHEPGSDVGLEHQREVVGKDLVVSSPDSLNSDGVDAQELCRVQPPIVLLRYL